MKKLTVIFLGIFAIGCAGNNLKEDAYLLTDNPSLELSKMEKSLLDAKDDRIHLLSPNLYKKSKATYKTAKKLHTKGDKVKAVLSKLATSRALLKKARETAGVSKSSLKTLNQIRKRALNAGATAKTTGFNEAEESYLEITAAIEDGKLAWVNKNKEEVTEKYLDVELQAIKDKALGPARHMISKALEIDADDYAPKSLLEAQEYMAATDKYITQNRHERGIINDKAGMALFLANRTINITNYSKFVKESDPEEVALWVENQTNKLSNVLDEDYRDLQFKDQFITLRGQINSLRGGRDNLAGESAKLKNELSSLKQNSLQKKRELERLRKVREFNKKYAKVRRYFKKHEAEVYKQGDKLVIRLKGVKFQSGKSVLVSKNYPLMNKVKKAIGTFGESKVLIEGHTDSRGSAKTNLKLSKARAKSVKDYILANSDIPRQQIRSRGLGFKRPIATNKTQKGRSANRRIDIIIEPTKTESLLGGL